MSALPSLRKIAPQVVGTYLRSYGSSKFTGVINPDKTVRSPFPDKHIPAEKSFVKHIFDQIDSFQSDIALVDGLSGKEVSFAQLRDTSSKLSSGLRRLGLQRGDVLAVCAPNSIEFVNILFATMAAGGVVSTCNPTFTAQELNYQFNNSRAKYVATTPLLLPTVTKAVKNTSVEKVLVIGPENQEKSSCFISLHSLFEDSGSLFEIERVDSKEDVAVLPYSSGTTGLPKGVMLTHHNIIANCCQLDHPGTQGLSCGETILTLLPLFHIYGMVVSLYIGLYTGCRQIILPKFEPVSFLSAIERHRIHSANLVPPIILFLGKHEEVPKYDLSSLRYVTSGAAPLGGEVLQNARARTGMDVIRQGYGLTETSPVTHTKPYGMGMEKPRSIGPPLPNQLCKVVDPETGLALGPNSEGEVAILGPNVMKGYLNKPEETAKCIDRDGWFHTGDIGYYDSEGHFYITDRLKELIKVKGLQVAPAELEALLLHHPKIKDAAVIGVPHERLGEAPKAFVVRKNPSALEESEIKKYVEENISEHKWLAGGVEFIDEIPKSASGKILRRKLK